MSESNTPQHEVGRGTILSYTIGFVCSILLTLVAYWLVDNQVLQGVTLVAAIIGLAISQLFVQLVFFLHLGRESKPYWNLTVFSFAALVVLIVVIGSLWIMKNLDYHMMPPMETDQYIIKDEGINH